MAIHMFQQLIDSLKKSPKRIVFTEGTDARILEMCIRDRPRTAPTCTRPLTCRCITAVTWI